MRQYWQRTHMRWHPVASVVRMVVTTMSISGLAETPGHGQAWCLCLGSVHRQMPWNWGISYTTDVSSGV